MTIALFAVNAAQADVFDGSWWNFGCAQMQLTVSNSSVSGRYLPPAESQHSVEIQGLRAGTDLIVLIGRVGADGPLLSWMGQHTIPKAGNEKIVVRWSMGMDVPDEEETEAQILQYLWAGSETFMRTKPIYCK